MSTDYDANLVVGIKLADVFTFEILPTDVTKYNQDTGEPYNIKVKMLYGTIGNKILKPVAEYKNKFTCGEEFRVDFDDVIKSKETGLQIITPRGHSEAGYVKRHGILGIYVTDPSPRKGYTLEELTEISSKVKKCLKDTIGYDGEVLYLAQLSIT